MNSTSGWLLFAWLSPWLATKPLFLSLPKPVTTFFNLSFSFETFRRLRCEKSSQTKSFVIKRHRENFRGNNVEVGENLLSRVEKAIYISILQLCSARRKHSPASRLPEKKFDFLIFPHNFPRANGFREKVFLPLISAHDISTKGIFNNISERNPKKVALTAGASWNPHHLLR